MADTSNTSTDTSNTINTESTEIEVAVTTEVEQAPDPVAFPYQGLPCFVVANDADIKAAERIATEQMLFAYYLLGSDDKGAPRIYKVTSNTVNLAIGEVNKSGLVKIKETAWFRLPKMPWDMVRKIDAFFRKVDKDLGGSESIVILGWDTRCGNDDPTGWRIIVPEQENNAGHCNYKPTSVVDYIPDEDIDYIQLVGTCHSHPKMSAFCSGTDKADQESFDGLHITFGWTTGPTEYHAEFQVAGVAYAIKDLTMIFDQPEVSEDHPEFEEWLKRVKKEQPRYMSSYSWSGNSWSGKTGTGAKTGAITTSKPGGEEMRISQYAPDRSKYTVVTEFRDASAKECPVCFKTLVADEVDDRRCTRCMTYLLMPEEELADISRIRKFRKLFVWELDPEIAEKPIAVWRRANIKDYRGKIEYIPLQKKDQGK